MKKAPFFGKFSGFLLIGEEQAEYDGEMLVSYVARPYCSDPAELPEPCMVFRDDCLILRDVRSAEDSRYDCVWTQEDIESVLDRLGAVAAYKILEISCETPVQLVLPSDRLEDDREAFSKCPNLREIVYFGERPFVLDDISVISAEKYLAGEERQSKAGSPSLVPFQPDEAEEARVEKKLSQITPTCEIVTEIPDFAGKVFYLAGFMKDEVRVFQAALERRGAVLCEKIGADTDYVLATDPTGMTKARHNAVLKQAKNGHTVRVIFFNDFMKYMS